MKDPVMDRLDYVDGRIEALFNYNPFRTNDKAMARGDIQQLQDIARIAITRLRNIRKHCLQYKSSMVSTPAVIAARGLEEIEDILGCRWSG